MISLSKRLLARRYFITPLVVLTLAVSILRPTDSEAVQVGECDIYSASQTFETTENPRRDRILLLDVEDSAIQLDSHVSVSISELSAQGNPFFGEAVFYINDVAPYSGGFLLRIGVITEVSNIPLDYEIRYTAFTGDCQ